MAYENYAFSPATSIPYLVNDTGADQVKIPIDFSTYTNGWTFECWFTTYNANPLFAGTPVFQYSVNSSIHITIAWGSALQTQFQLFVYIEGPGMTPTVLQLPPNWSNNGVAGYFYVAVSLRAAADGTSYAYGLSSRQIHTSSTFNTQSPQTFNGVSPSNFAGATFATIGSMDGAALGNNVPAQFFAGQDRKAYSGRIAEVRIWNQYIAPAALQPNFEVSPSSPGLTHLYRFAVSPTNNIATAAAPGTALQLRGNIIVLDAAKDFNQGNDRAVMDIPTYSAVISDTNSNPQFSIPTFDVFGDFGAPSPTSSASFSSPSPALVLSPAVSGSTVGIFSSPGTSSSNTFIGSTLNFTRAFCGSLANVTITVTSSVGTPSVVATPLQLQLSWPSLSWQVTSVSIPPTTGGTVTITGTNFGIASSLAGTESILLKGVACTSAVVVSTTSIQCQIAAGTGSGLASISICGVTNSSASSFRYAAPVVSAVNTVDLSTIRLTGTGFNPSSTWNTGRDSIRVTGGTLPAAGVNCAVNSTSVTSATEVSCIPATALVAGSSYSVNITIDGQSTTQSFSFSPCFPACQNNGQCVGVNQCNCLGTSGSGPLCGTPVICSPECQNGGTCYNPNTGSGNTTAGTCNCAVSTNPGSDGDCSTRLVESTLSTGAIIGIAVGVGVVLIVLVVVIIILAIRRPKRYKSSAIIPVEKKDFTKIIYGEQLDEGHPDKKAGDLDALENLLVQGNLDTVFALNKITAITEADKIAKALVIIFEAHHKTMDLLKAFTTDEVKATDSAANLFRSNSMVSKMFKFYSRLVGLPYLYKTIAPEIYEIVEKEELHLEVDPEKLEEGSDLDEMRWTLMAESQKILKQILHSVTGIPAPFAELMSHVKSTVVSKFPDNVNTTIGGFIFLRFFCPAISSPEAYGVVEEPPQPNARRLLILITKVLQNLSNDVEFGSKEPYMTKMNDFIITNRPKISEFYVNMEKSRSNAFNAPTLPKHMKAVSLAVISEHFRTNFDKIENKDLKTQLDPIIKKD